MLCIPWSRMSARSITVIDWGTLRRAVGVRVAVRLWELAYPERVASTVNVLRRWTVVSRTAVES
jgi:hypothetical protein